MIDLNALRRTHGRFLDALTTTLRHGARQFGGSVVASIRSGRGIGFKPRSGLLQRSTQYTLADSGGRLRLKFTNAAKHAMPIENGSRPHPIVARRAPLLVFFWEKVGKWMAVKKVNHPGNKAYAFLRTAIYNAGRAFQADMKSKESALAARF